MMKSKTTTERAGAKAKRLTGLTVTRKAWTDVEIDKGDLTGISGVAPSPGRTIGDSPSPGRTLTFAPSPGEPSLG